MEGKCVTERKIIMTEISRRGNREKQKVGEKGQGGKGRRKREESRGRVEARNIGEKGKGCKGEGKIIILS